jgi:hypothetical protein
MLIKSVAQSVVLLMVIVNKQPIEMSIPNKSVTSVTMFGPEVWEMVEWNWTATGIFPPNAISVCKIEEISGAFFLECPAAMICI